MSSLSQLVTGVVDYLDSYAGLVALIGDRIYPHPLPEDRVIPSVTWQVEACPNTHISDYAHAYFRFSAWAYTKLLSYQIAEQIRFALEKTKTDFGTVSAFSMVEDMSDGAYESVPGGGLYSTHVYARILFKQDS